MEHESTRYYRKAVPTSLWRRVLRREQGRLYERFVAAFPPDASRTVINVGANGALTERDAWFLESRYPYLNQVTTCGLESSDTFDRLFPEGTYVQIRRGAPLPFADASFDLAFCSAVVEHVGDRAAQAAFLLEVTRVARWAFVTTPNRWYPVELHTMIPFVHYLPTRVYRRVYAGLGFVFFAKEENLNLLDRRSLLGLVPGARSARLEVHRFLGLPSNLLLVVGDAG